MRGRDWAQTRFMALMELAIRAERDGWDVVRIESYRLSSDPVLGDSICGLYIAFPKPRLRLRWRWPK